MLQDELADLAQSPFLQHSPFSRRPYLIRKHDFVLPFGVHLSEEVLLARLLENVRQSNRVYRYLVN